MEKVREILRLSCEAGLSQRDVAQGTGYSLGMVNAILTKVKEAGIIDPLSLSSKELGSILYPPGKQGTQKAEPDLKTIDREMKRKGVTLFLLWEEYRLQYPDGCIPSSANGTGNTGSKIRCICGRSTKQGNGCW